MADEKPKIPSWATWKKGQVIVDMDTAYPKYLEQLELTATQYATGVVKLCITRDLSEMTGIEGLVIRFKGTQDWKLENLIHGLPQRHMIAYQEKLKKLDAKLKSGEITEDQAADARQSMDADWMKLIGNSHDEGVKDGGKFRQRLINKRAAQALASE